MHRPALKLSGVGSSGSELRQRQLNGNSIITSQDLFGMQTLTKAPAMVWRVVSLSTRTVVSARRGYTSVQLFRNELVMLARSLSIRSVIIQRKQAKQIAKWNSAEGKTVFFDWRRLFHCRASSARYGFFDNTQEAFQYYRGLDAGCQAMNRDGIPPWESSAV